MIQPEDWTAYQGKANSSTLYMAIVQDVERVIRDGEHFLLTGQANAVARIIVSRIAHTHGLAPRGYDHAR